MIKVWDTALALGAHQHQELLPSPTTIMYEDCNETQDNRNHLKDDDMNHNIVVKLTAEETFTQITSYTTITHKYCVLPARRAGWDDALQNT